MQDQTVYTEEDFRALQDVPSESFKEDLRTLCRSAFGPDWTDKHPGQAAIDRLRGYGFLPEAFVGMYEVIGGEERLHQAGLLPVEQMELDQQSRGELTAGYLIFCRWKDVEYSFSRFYWPTGHGHLDRPFCGVHRFSYKNLFYKKWKIWEKWCYWGGPSQFQTLSDALLRLVGELLRQALPHCVCVKMPLKKEGELSRYASIAKRLGVRTLETVHPMGWEYLCGPERGLVARYCEDSAKKLLVYSRDPLPLEQLGEKWPVQWQKRDGKKVLDPSKFLLSPAPATFEEKLEAMSRVLLGKRSLALPPEEVDRAEARSGVSFPQPLRQFYLRFGKGGKLFSRSALEKIYTPGELELEDGRILLAEENQGIWRIYLDGETGEHYMILEEERTSCWGLDLEDTLLALLGLNALGFLPHGGACDLEDTPENRALLGHYFHTLTQGELEVLLNPERGLTGSRSGGRLYIMARTEKALNDLERDTDLTVSSF